MTKERQTGKTLIDIRDDHYQRYLAAIDFIRATKSRDILDIGSGVGYGAYMMACHGFSVRSVEKDVQAFLDMLDGFNHDRIVPFRMSFEDYPMRGNIDLLTCFEIIEHSEKSEEFLFRASKKIKYLIGSVPNELVVNFDKSKHHFHVRHYTPFQIKKMLNNSCWDLITMGYQVGKVGIKSHVIYTDDENRINKGRTLIFKAKSKRYKFK